MRLLVSIFLCIQLAILCAHCQQVLNICSFNVQVFGVTKMSKPDVVQVLVNIFRRYDVCLIQEIRDTTDTAVWSLLEKINAGLPQENQYKLVLSDRLGRTSSKEQYGFFYKDSKISLLGNVQYYDVNNYFERPPFSIIVQPKNAADNERTLFLTADHIKPTDAPAEIDNMVDAYESLLANTSIPQNWRDALAKRWLFMGDLNAGCSYVSNSKWSNIRLRNQTTVWSSTGQTIPRFHFLIDDNTGTTTTTGCPYDRFVATPGLTPTYAAPGNVQVVAGSPKPFNFTYVYGLNLTFAQAVSDHFPIELQVTNFFVTPVQSLKPKLSRLSSGSTVGSSIFLILAVALLLVF